MSPIRCWQQRIICWTLAEWIWKSLRISLLPVLTSFMSSCSKSSSSQPCSRQSRSRQQKLGASARPSFSSIPSQSATFIMAVMIAAAFWSRATSCASRIFLRSPVVTVLGLNFLRPSEETPICMAAIWNCSLGTPRAPRTQLRQTSVMVLISVIILETDLQQSSRCSILSLRSTLKLAFFSSSSFSLRPMMPSMMSWKVFWLQPDWAISSFSFATRASTFSWCSGLAWSSMSLQIRRAAAARPPIRKAVFLFLLIQLNMLYLIKILSVRNMNNCRRIDVDSESLKRLEHEIRALKYCPRNSGSGHCPLSKQPLEEVHSDEFYLDRLKGQREKIQTLKHDYAKKVEKVAEVDEDYQSLVAEHSRLFKVKEEYYQLAQQIEVQGYELDAVRNDRDELQAQAAKFQMQDSKTKAKQLGERSLSVKAQTDLLSIRVDKLQQLCVIAGVELKELKDKRDHDLALLKQREVETKEQLQRTRMAQELITEENNKLEANLLNLTKQTSQQIAIFRRLDQNSRRLEVLLDKASEEIGQEERLAQASKQDCVKEISNLALLQEKLTVFAKKQQGCIHEYNKRQKQHQSRFKIVNSQALKLDEALARAQESTLNKKQRITELENETRSDGQTIARLKKAIQNLEQQDKEEKQCALLQRKQRSEAGVIKAEMKRRKQFEVQRIEELVASLSKK